MSTPDTCPKSCPHGRGFNCPECWPKGRPAPDVTLHEGGTSITGPDAMLLFKAVQLRAFLRLYIKTGIRPTRGVGPRAMLDAATGITGKPYKGRQYPQAMADLDVWIDTMRGALDIRDERGASHAV